MEKDKEKKSAYREFTEALEGNVDIPEEQQTEQPSPPPPEEPPPPPPQDFQPNGLFPQPEQSQPAWKFWLIYLTIVALLFYIAFFKTFSVGEIKLPKIDFSQIEAAISSMAEKVDLLKSRSDEELNNQTQQVHFLQQEPEPVVAKEEPPAPVVDDKIKTLEGKNRWLRHIEKTTRKTNGTLSASLSSCESRVKALQASISNRSAWLDRHYKMREMAVREFFNAPLREGENRRVLCFTTNGEQKCWYREDKAEPAESEADVQLD